jgi:hypothetical protein
MHRRIISDRGMRSDGMRTWESQFQGNMKRTGYLIILQRKEEVTVEERLRLAAIHTLFHGLSG